MKKNLFITSKSDIEASNNQILIKSQELKKVPILLIDNIFIFGKSQIDYRAIDLSLKNGINIYFLSYSGRLKGILSNIYLKSNHKNRILQYELYQNRKLDVAKNIVLAKIDSIERSLILDFEKEKSLVKNAKAIETILGYEGVVSKYFFDDIRSRLKRVSIDFKSRSYNPAKDFVNASLSFVYTLYYLLLYPIIISKGFDSYLGFLHKKRGEHHCFISDIMEINRVSLSNFVINLIVDEVVRADDFDKDLKLKQEKLKAIIYEFILNFIENREELDESKKFIKRLIDANSYVN